MLRQNSNTVSNFKWDLKIGPPRHHFESFGDTFDAKDCMAALAIRIDVAGYVVDCEMLVFIVALFGVTVIFGRKGGLSGSWVVDILLEIVFKLQIGACIEHFLVGLPLLLFLPFSFFPLNGELLGLGFVNCWLEA
jgi:hypothetical protein